VLIVEVDGLPAGVAAAAGSVGAIARDHGARTVRVAADPAEQALLWKGRKSALDPVPRIPPNYSLHDAVVPRTRLVGGLEEGLSIIIYMGLEQKGWIWVFPLGENRITAGFVAQNSYISDQQRKLKGSGSKDWKQDLCMQELLHSKYVKGLLEGSKMLIPMQINGNYSYEVKNHYGSNYAMVGDARGFVDPIFSSGVFLSIKSASLVSAAIHKQLTGQVNGKNEEMETAYQQITGAYNFVHRMIKLFYNPHSVTWAQAGADGEAHKNHESAMAAGHYMLSGDFFENYKKFEGFFEILEDPEQFRRYKRLVIDRDEFVQPTCSSRSDEVFKDMVQRDQERTVGLAL
jgi:flavin-dependent dehydrogenase